MRKAGDTHYLQTSRCSPIRPSYNSASQSTKNMLEEQIDWLNKFDQRSRVHPLNTTSGSKVTTDYPLNTTSGSKVTTEYLSNTKLTDANTEDFRSEGLT